MTTQGVVIRGVRVKKRVGQKGIERLVRHTFPDTRFLMSASWPVYRIQWTGNPTYEDMRALADEIETAALGEPALKIVCRHEETEPPWPVWKWADTFNR